MTLNLDSKLERAVSRLKRGGMVLIFDSEDREGETDFAKPAMAVTPRDVLEMRREGGGLICVAISRDAAEVLGLPFMADILRQASNNGNGCLAGVVENVGDISYDSRSAFSLWVNHRDTFTGITDLDRSLTIRKLGEAVSCVVSGGKFDFGRSFRSPGHVAVLRAARGLLDERRGQTELSIALAGLSGIPPAMALCEMLDSETGRALPKEKAKEYGKKRGIPFLEGGQIIEAWEKVKEEDVMAARLLVPSAV